MRVVILGNPANHAYASQPNRSHDETQGCCGETRPSGRPEAHHQDFGRVRGEFWMGFVVSLACGRCDAAGDR